MQHDGYKILGAQAAFNLLALARKVLCGHADGRRLANELLVALDHIKAPSPPDYSHRLTQGMSEAGRMAAHHRAVDALLAPPVPGRIRAPWPDFNGEPIHEGDVIEHPDGTRGVVTRLNGRFLDEGDRWRVRYGDDPAPSRLGLQIGRKGRAVVVKP